MSTLFYVSPFAGNVKSTNDNIFFFVILSEKVAKFCEISLETVKITGTGHKHDLTEVKRDYMKC